MAGDPAAQCRESSRRRRAPTFESARARLRGQAHVTPVLTSRTLDQLAGARLFSRRRISSRWAPSSSAAPGNASASMPAAERARGVVTQSSGNHAQAVALAARLHGVPAHIVMPDNAPAVKVAAVRGLRRRDLLLPADAGRPRPGDRRAAGAHRRAAGASLRRRPGDRRRVDRHPGAARGAARPRPGDRPGRRRRPPFRHRAGRPAAWRQDPRASAPSPTARTTPSVRSRPARCRKTTRSTPSPTACAPTFRRSPSPSSARRPRRS